jgi:hypothetical protein
MDFSIAFVDIILTFMMPKKIIGNRLHMHHSIDAYPQESNKRALSEININ